MGTLWGNVLFVRGLPIKSRIIAQIGGRSIYTHLERSQDRFNFETCINYIGETMSMRKLFTLCN